LTTSPQTPLPSIAARVRGCLLGGAVGDALGGSVEFDSLARIRERFGPAGLTDYSPAYGRRGAVTDDTQMTLFTVEGLIRAYVRGSLKGICHAPSVVDHAYARWLSTQGQASPRWRVACDGWLITNKALHSRRAPGMTCLSALEADRMGTIDDPLNTSKGCGGVMRAAPAGLLGPRFPLDPFGLGCEVAALTHGHPTGYLTAGVLAAVIASIVWSGSTLDVALDVATSRLRQEPGHEETLEAIAAARRLAAASGTSPAAEAVQALGEGWVAEEALGISVYCALVARDFEHGVLLAVNHSGDSDSTGAITGSILGAIQGDGVIPQPWIDELELNAVIRSLAADWIDLFVGASRPNLEGDATWWDRYPGW
jgi:ADP-ribosylglycohydrolase